MSAGLSLLWLYFSFPLVFLSVPLLLLLFFSVLTKLEAVLPLKHLGEILSYPLAAPV